MSKWRKVKFLDLFALPSRNGLTKPSRVRGSGYKMINMGELFSNGRIYDIPMELVPLNDKEKEVAKVERYDLLFARQSLVLEGAGKCSIVMDVSDLTTFESHLIRVRLDSNIANPLFYYYYFSSSLSPISSIVSQCAQAGIKGSDLVQIMVDFPPLHIQHRIATILSRYDSLIENYQKQIKLLEESAQRLYKEWFIDLRFPGHENTKIVDGVPEGWEKGILDNIAYEAGKKIDKKYRENYGCYMPIDCLPKKSFTYIESASILLAESSLVSFKKGDIIFGAMRPYFHKVCFAQSEGLTRTTCFVLNSRLNEYREYLLMLMFEDSTVKHATSISVGTTMPYTRWKDLKSMEILIPDKKTVVLFGKEICKITEALQDFSLQIRYLTEARDRLLPKLMSGEIEV